MKRIWLLLLIVASGHATFAQNQSVDELRRVFDYDQNAPLDIKEVSVINRNGVRIHDINYASPKGGRVTPVAPILRMGLEQAPQFNLKDIDGRAVRLSDYHGKVVLINFWATWCPPCRAEMPDLVRLQREHANQGLQIIGITYPPERVDRVRRFARSLKVNYPIVLGTREIRARFSSEETLPLTVVINRDGKVSDIISGILLREEFDEKIKPLLMQKTEGEMIDAKSDH